MTMQGFVHAQTHSRCLTSQHACAVETTPLRWSQAHRTTCLSPTRTLCQQLPVIERHHIAGGEAGINHDASACSLGRRSGRSSCWAEAATSITMVVGLAGLHDRRQRQGLRRQQTLCTARQNETRDKVRFTEVGTHSVGVGLYETTQLAELSVWQLMLRATSSNKELSARYAEQHQDYHHHNNGVDAQPVFTP